MLSVQNQQREDEDTREEGVRDGVCFSVRCVDVALRCECDCHKLLLHKGWDEALNFPQGTPSALCGWKGSNFISERRPCVEQSTRVELAFE